jgi:chromosome segregation ATPase
MDLIVMILAAMSGALIGSSTGIFLMYRKLRPVNAAELDALRTKVRTTEFDLNAAIANGAKLKKELAEQGTKVSDEVVEKQKQLEAAVAAKDLESAHRNAAEQRIAELIAEADTVKARGAELENRIKELEAKPADAAAAQGADPVVLEEQQKQIAAFQAQIETGVKQNQELTEQVTRLSVEALELKQRADETERARLAMEAELKQRVEESEKTRTTVEAELTQRAEEAEKTRLAIEEAAKQHAEEAEKARIALEADLTGERERLHILTEQVSELQSELAAQDVRMQEERVRMQEERESAAKGMELLVMAQQNLSRVIQQVVPETNGNGNGHAAEEAAANGNGHAVAAEVPAATNGAGAASTNGSNNGHSETAPAVVTELQTAAVGK